TRLFHEEIHMSLSIHTNFASLVTQNTLSKNNSALSTAMQRLGTGLRINSAADDAAGLQIANRLTAQTRGMAVAQRNAQDAISMLQTADGALDEISNIAFRMKDLALQAANGSNNADDRTALNAEYTDLKNEISAILKDTTYGGEKLFTSLLNNTNGIDFQIGVTGAEKLNVGAQTNVEAIATFDAGGNVTGGALNSAGALDTQANSVTAIGNLDTLIKAVGTARAQFGANINRLDHTINNLASIAQNTEAAKGRIMDADFAAES